MVDGVGSWWRFLALTLIVLLVTLSVSLAVTAIWTDLLRANVRTQQEILIRLELQVDGLRREVEAFGRVDLSRGIDLSQLKSRLERVEIRYAKDVREDYMKETEEERGCQW